MNRLKVILGMWATLLLYLAFTSHSAAFNGSVVSISFIVVVIAAAKVMSKPNAKEKAFMDEWSNLK